MTLSGESVRPARKGFLAFSIPNFDASAQTKYYLVGNDGDVGPTFDFGMRVTGVAIQAEITTLEASDAILANVFKGTEGAGAVYSASVSTAAATTVEATDYTPSSEAASVYTANTDDLIVTVTSTASTAVATGINVQVFYEVDE